MKTLLKLFGYLALVFILCGLFLSNKIDIRRSVEIHAPIELIHSQVNDLTNWPNWSPWMEMDPTIETSIGDIKSGKGAHQSWQGQSGSGRLTFTESSVLSGIVYDMSYDGDSTVYQAGLSYETIESNRTLVTWYMTGEMQPLIIGNYFAQVMDALVGDSFKAGLDKLKEVAENINTLPSTKE